MGITYKIFVIGLKQVRRDGMLLLLLPAPFLMGAALRVLLPLADQILRKNLSFSIAPWYGLADAMLIIMTPCMAAMVSAFLMLEEWDEGINLYYAITPAAGGKYLVARLLIPMIWAFACSILAKLLFGLTVSFWPQLIAAAALSTIHGCALGLFVVVFAHNKVEGLALSKLMGVFTLGIPAVWFIKEPYQYLAGFLPSFWIGRLLAHPDFIAVILGVVTTLFWTMVFLKLFLFKTDR